MSKKVKYRTREDWLHAAAMAWAPEYKAAGWPLPSKLRIGVGWMAQGMRTNTIGQAWHDTASSDGTREVTISIKLDDPLAVLATLRHELCHTALPREAKHGPMFRKLATAVGLEGPAKATHAGDELTKSLKRLLKELGAYPHAALVPSTEIKKQTTRMLKAECDKCDMLLRLTAKHAPKANLCPNHEECGGHLTVYTQDGEPWNEEDEE